MRTMRCSAALLGLVLLAWASGPVAHAQSSAEPAFARISVRPLAANIVIPQTRVVMMEAREGTGGVRMTEVRAEVEIHEQVAMTTLDISLHNPSHARLEAELLVPVPENAVVRGFTFQGSGKEPSAALLPRDEARRMYDSIVRQVRDPALLEFVGYNLIRSSVFPVEPNGQQKVRLTYEHICAAEAGRIDYVLPRSESLEYSVPWRMTVRIKSKTPVSTVYSPSHRLEVQRPDAHTILAKTTEEAIHEAGPFRVTYLPQSDGMTASLLAYPDPKVGGGYFLLLAGLPAKPEQQPNAKPIKREITLVLDRSGSMNGEKIKQVREAATQIIAGLESGESFNILPYNEAVDTFAPAAVVKDAKTEAAARQYIAGIQARGGTNIHDALLEALRQKPAPDVLPIVLFLTDGLATVGNTAEVAIRDLATKANPHKRRIFTFGVGVDVNTPLLDKLADLTRATATFVLPKEDVEVKVGQVFRRLEGPVLADPELAVLDADGKPAVGRTRDLLPSRLPDLFSGDQLILLGQYIGEDPLSFRLNGNFLGEKRAFNFSFPLEKATTRNSFVPRLWASRKIGVLIDAIRSLGADQQYTSQRSGPPTMSDPRMKELVDEVVRLSQEFGILTEYTAFLAREGNDLADNPRNREQANARFGNRAVQQRDGWASVSQEKNKDFYRDQSVLNGGNVLIGAGTVEFKDGNTNANALERIQISNVQQSSDRAFFNNDGRWVEGRVALRATSNRAALEPKKVIEFGSEEFMKLAHQLAAEGRQGSISLRGEILLEVGNEVVLVRNPVAPADVAASEAHNAKAAPARARRAESAEAERLIEAKK
ncbi:MAG: VIT domain-containing protein [Planctomycetota bacterium]|nr:VIT domain-containing protein [Planctomycetota bacterium]